MADRYVKSIVPEEYDPTFFETELKKIEAMLQAFEIPEVVLVPQHVEPAKLILGMVIYADGSDWNPGHGGGVYEYNTVGWTPLFPLVQGVVTARVHVGNTTTETTIYTTTIAANQLSLEEILKLTLSGYYDTDAASDSWTLRVKLGGTTLHTVVRSSGNNASDFGWSLELETTMRTIGASGTLIDLATLMDDDTSQMSADSTLHTINTTIDNDLIVTVQWALAKVGNDFHLDQGKLQAFH